MFNRNALCTGAAVGAGAMFLFDPQQGRRRRALLRDQINRAGRELSESLDVACRDLNHRVQGTIAEMASCLSSEEVADDVLVQRVRSKLGRWVAHPAAIEVDACDGCVLLRGPILSHEVQNAVHGVKWIHGVRGVENLLEVHESAGDVSALQGAGKYGEGGLDMFQTNWAPGTRLVAGTAGGLLILNCLASRSLGGMLMGTLGLGLFMRSMTNAALFGRSTGGTGGTGTRPHAASSRASGEARRAGSDGRPHALATTAPEIPMGSRWPQSPEAPGQSPTSHKSEHWPEATEQLPPAV